MTKKYELTKEHENLIPEHNKKWVDIILNTDRLSDKDKELCVYSINKMYDIANLDRPKTIVFVSNPILLAFAGGLSRFILNKRNKTEDSATDSATRSATYSATYSATDSAIISATDYSYRDSATRSATISATRSATYSATYSATRSATISATRSATYQAKCAKEVGLPEKIYLHAEIDAILRCNDLSKAHSIHIFRQGKSGQYLLAKPCPSCANAISKTPIKKVFHT